MIELCQLYDESGKPIEGQGAPKTEIFKGALHGAIHVWIWRLKLGRLEVLLQHRAPEKPTWPNHWGESVGGHISLGEKPEVTALRETQEEIGLKLQTAELVFILKHRGYFVAENGAIENEFRWVYAYRFENETKFKLEDKKVDAVEWRLLEVVEEDLADKKRQKNYLPQGAGYYSEVFGAITKLARQQLK